MLVQNVPSFQHQGIACVQKCFWGQRRYSICKVFLNEKYYVAIFFIRIFSKCSIAWQCLAEHVHVQYFSIIILPVFFKVQYCLAVFSSACAIFLVASIFQSTVLLGSISSAWAIFRGMRCEALPASLYVNTLRADSAFMIKNANSTFHGQ